MAEYEEQIPGGLITRRKTRVEQTKVGRIGTWIYDIFVELPVNSSFWSKPENVRRIHMLNNARLGV